MDKKIKIISVATEDYHDYMLALLLSFQQQCQSYKDLVSFKLYLINYQEPKRSEFLRINLNIEKVFESHNFKNKSEQSCFCTNYRYILLKSNFDFNNIICWIDCDALFMKDCSHIFNTLVSEDRGIFLYEKNQTWKFRGQKYKTLMGGFIAVNANKLGEAFANDYFRQVGEYINKNKNRYNEWWANQQVLRIMIKNGPDYNPYFFQEPVFATESNKSSLVYFKDEKKRKHKDFVEMANALVTDFRNKK
jgi:hypothetical protein